MDVDEVRPVARDIPLCDTLAALGVVFFDFTHNSTGTTATYIELHPLTSLRRL